MKQFYIFLVALCGLFWLSSAPASAAIVKAPAEDVKVDTVDVFTSLFNIKDITAKQGVWMIQALDYELSDYEVVLVVKSKSFVGTYNASDILYVGNNATPLTCIYPRNSDTAIGVKSGHGVVSDKGSVRTFDFFLDAEDGKVYHLLVSYEWFTLSLDADKDFTGTYGKSALWIEDGGVALVASDDISRLGMVFYVSDPTVAKIPAGTYTFSYDKTPGTVLASLGVDKVALTLMPSYIGTIDADGNADEMWFLVSGTAVVEEDDGKCNIAIDALNSKGRRVQVTIAVTVTALDSPEADTFAPRKTLHNGRVVIIRGNRMFDLNGNPVAD